MVGLVGVSVFVKFLEHSSISVNATVAFFSLGSSIGRYKTVIFIQSSCQFHGEGVFVVCELDPL